MKKILLLLLLIGTLHKNRAQSIEPNKIDIVRDSFGIPHIFAKTDAEVAYGLAWAHAEDDFKSLQLLLLPGKGLLGAEIGKQGAAADYAFALLRCREITHERWHTLSPAFIKLIEGYVQGINSYAAKHPDEIIQPPIFPITLEDYIAASVFAITIFNGVNEVLLNIFNNTQPITTAIPNKGSNAIAVHSSKSSTGENFLVVNAHQPNTGPQAFYEAHLCSNEGLNVLGGLLAGGSCILHGANEYLGWAHTVNYCDRVDVFQLEINPQNKNQYKFDGQWLNLETKKIKLKIKGLPIKIARTLYWSKYGPTIKNKSGYFSIRTPGNMRIGALEQWYHMDKARNFTEFYQALKLQELSMFNITYADRYDTIFYINNALMPVRNPDTAYHWKLTVPGNTSRTLWTEFRKTTELPQYINPENGFLFNTNHSPFFATTPKSNLNQNAYPKTDGWEDYHNNRSKRLLEIMPEGLLSYDSLKTIKFDKQLPAQLWYRYKIDSLSTLNEKKYPEYASMLDTWKKWNHRGDTNSKGAALFLLFYLHLSKTLKGQPARQITQAEALQTLNVTKKYLLKHFNSTDITLGELQKLVRGNKVFALWGLPDLLSPQWTQPFKKGQLQSIGGDGYIMFIRFSKNKLPIIETVNMYGASAKPSSPHYNDQIQLYLQQKTKPMTLDKQFIYSHAIKIYHPG